MRNQLKEFEEIGDIIQNLINSKTKEQKRLHEKELLNKFPNLNPFFLLILESQHYETI